MANISTYLQAIMNAVYGEEVRGSIHDAISIINDVGEKVLTVGTAVTSSSSSTEGFFNESLYLNNDTWELWKCNGSRWVSQGNVKGRGIESVTKKSTSGLVDTYEIDYDKGASTEFQVTNGNGIKSFSKTGSSGLSDIYTIVFDDESIQRIYVANGRGITSIEKTGTSGNVDTYKINYNDRTSSTFQVTNGTDGADGFSPTVSVSKTGKDTTVTITTADGPSTFHVLDGADGQGSGDMLTSVYDKNQNGIVDAAEAVPWSGVTGKDGMSDGLTTSINGNKLTANGVAILSTVNPSGTVHGANWLKHGNTVLTPSNIQLYLVWIDGKPTLWNWNGTAYVEVTSDGGVSSYTDLTNKPSINGVELNGAMTSSMLHIGGEIPEIIPIERGGTGNNAGYIRTGLKSNTTIGKRATAEGYNVTASGDYSHGEGSATKATGKYSHSEGDTTAASGLASHSEGNHTTASGAFSHAEGDYTTASGQSSHAGGNETIAAHNYQTAIGRYNDNKSDTLFEVGNGSAESNRSNAFEVYKNGDANVNGRILCNGDYIFAKVNVSIPLYSEARISANGSKSSIGTVWIPETSTNWKTFFKMYEANLTLFENIIFHGNVDSSGASYKNMIDITCPPGEVLYYEDGSGQKKGRFEFSRVVNLNSSEITLNSVSFTVIYFPTIYSSSMNISSR